MASNTPSLFKSVAVFSATVLSSATVAGYVAYFNGNTATTGDTTSGNGVNIQTSLGDAACQKNAVTGKYYDCHQEVVFTNTGASVGAKYYNVASITKPYTGSGTIQKVDISCGITQGVSTRVSVDQLSATTLSGTSILNHKLIGSGAYAISTSVGVTNSGSIIWGKATPNIKVSAVARVGANSTCRLRVDSSEM